MIRVVCYLVSLLASVVFLAIANLIWVFPEWYTDNLLIVRCCLIGMAAGVLYCLRAIYQNKCVYKRWDEDWLIWYFLRPITSGMSGFVSFIFLRAGLLTLDATPGDVTTPFGYLALAFIAGYNVDKFLKKIEELARTVWGIKKTNVASSDDELEGSE